MARDELETVNQNPVAKDGVNELWIHSPDLLIDDTESELESWSDLGNEGG